jgi:hypothetical protein
MRNNYRSNYRININIMDGNGNAFTALKGISGCEKNDLQSIHRRTGLGFKLQYISLPGKFITCPIYCLISEI